MFVCSSIYCRKQKRPATLRPGSSSLDQREKARTSRLLLVLLTVAALNGCVVQAMLYPVPDYPVGRAPAGHEEIQIESDGHAAIFWAARPGQGPEILYFHGNGENLGTLRDSGFLTGSGWGRISAVDYPGYGRSPGRPSEAANLAIATAALKASRNRSTGPIIVMGWSLGAAVAIQAAANAGPDQVKCLVLLSPWHSLAEVAGEHFPRPLVWLLLREKYDSGSAGKRLGIPVLVIHGREDTLIRAWHGRELARAIPNARFVEIPGAAHNDLLSHPLTTQTVGEFLADNR